MKLFDQIRTRRTVQKLLSEGGRYQQEKNLEEAYARYHSAAELGSPEAMTRIGALYYSEMFRPVEQSNLMDLFRQGIPAFPWNTVTQTVPDYKTALEWFRKAADLGHAPAACMVGAMLCEGVGCRQDIVNGRKYLQTAAEAGVPGASKALCLYGEHVSRQFTQEAYETLLNRFANAVVAGQEEAYTLYDQLKGGNGLQLARLGYMITAGKNSGHPGFAPFQHSTAESGIPLLPVCMKRCSWKSFLRVDLNAFASDDVRLAFSTDIDPEFTLGAAHRLVPGGTAVYRSPAFGWLNEEKHAMLFRIDRKATLNETGLRDIVEQFMLIEEEFRPDNAAFLVECGEKEYSVEIAAIANDQVDILLRYTVGGSDNVSNYFMPELISVTEE